MVKIALVEDTDADALLTSQALDRFAGDEGLHFEVTRYTSAEDFLTDAPRSLDRHDFS